MSFDFRPLWATLHDPGQVNEGGRNRSNNCVPDACHEVMQAITGQHIPPQQWTDYEYGTEYSGYTNLDKAVDFIRTHFADPPAMDISNPGDTFAYVNEVGSRGWPVACLFHIDNSVSIGSSGSGYHCSPPVASDGVNWMVVRNVWAPGWYQTFSRVAFNAAASGTNAGTMITFRRPVRSLLPAADDNLVLIAAASGG